MTSKDCHSRTYLAGIQYLLNTYLVYRYRKFSIFIVTVRNLFHNSTILKDFQLFENGLLIYFRNLEPEAKPACKAVDGCGE